MDGAGEAQSEASVDGEFLSVRETARLLEVHENTVRNWSKSGQLKDERVPGSRFHRFRRADVERLATQRGQSRPSLSNDRTAIGPELVDAAQIDQWANSADARRLFPEMVRRLMAVTPGVSGMAVRIGEATDWSGWDGIARSLNTPYLPTGSLKLEVGVSKRPKVKADNDWNDRLPVASRDDVFVFVTPRRWPGAQDWARARTVEGKYSAVAVVDADTVAGWLTKTPSVHYWFSEQLGRHPRDARSLEGWWNEFASSTEPRLPVEMFTSGRDVQSSALRNALSDTTARAISIRSEWHKDALAFLYGSLASDDGATLPVVIVDTPKVFASIAEEPAQVVLVPTFLDAEVTKALANGHHVVLVVDDAYVTSRPPDISLPRTDRVGTVDAFERNGAESRHADRYAAEARRNLQAFVRSISKDQRFARPDWAGPGYATAVARLTLVNRWTTGDADIACVAAFLDRPQDELEDLLDRFSGVDPVFRRTGRLWQLTSPREAFQLLAPTMASRTQLMESWADLAVESLSERDRVLDLPEHEQQFAGLRDVRRKLSSALRSGMARGIALVGVLGRDEDYSTPDDAPLSIYADRIVQRLLDVANDDSTGRRWLELLDVLVLLAEAAPRVFLDAVSNDLARPEPTLLTLFDDAGTTQPTFGRSSPHVRLLWALETLCWSPDYMLDAVDALAVLTAKDPGGPSGYRPIGSLASVLCGWVNHTSATHAQRVDAVRHVRHTLPGVGWQLTFALWPSANAISLPPHRPWMARWLPTQLEVPLSTWASFVHDLVDIACGLVDGNPVRVGKLVDHLGATSDSDQKRILAKLTEVTATVPLNNEARFELWRTLQSLVSKHEQFPASSWSYKAEQLAVIQAAADRIEPDDDPRRFAEYFGWRPDIPGVDRLDYDAYQARIEEMRFNALTTVLNHTDRMPALERLTRAAQAPGIVGGMLAQQPSIDLTDMRPWLVSEEAALVTAARVWVRTHVLAPDGPAWLRHTLDNPSLVGAARNLLLDALPLERQIWEVVDQDETDSKSFWSNVVPRDAKPGEEPAVVERLLARKRAWAAVAVLSTSVHQYANDSDNAPPTELIMSALWQAVAEEPKAAEADEMAPYDLGLLFDYLVQRGVEDADMARLEFAYFRILEHGRPAKALFYALATNPAMFAELVALAFTSRNPKPPARTDQERQLARQAYWVLRSWDGFPGQADDGSIDPFVFDNWVREARIRLSETGHTDIGDEKIGQTFAHAPEGADGIWPPDPIREAVERIGSNELDNGLVLGRLNSRGVTTRGAFEGGDQERRLAAQYRTWARSLRSTARRTSRALTSLAEDYEQHAKREDVRADIDADTD